MDVKDTLQRDEGALARFALYDVQLFQRRDNAINRKNIPKRQRNPNGLAWLQFLRK